VAKVVFPRKIARSPIVAIKIEVNSEDQEILIGSYVEEDGQHKLWSQLLIPIECKEEMIQLLSR
jgi:hypothetical protein